MHKQGLDFWKGKQQFADSQQFHPDLTTLKTSSCQLTPWQGSSLGAGRQEGPFSLPEVRKARVPMVSLDMMLWKRAS